MPEMYQHPACALLWFWGFVLCGLDLSEISGHYAISVFDFVFMTHVCLRAMMTF